MLRVSMTNLLCTRGYSQCQYEFPTSDAHMNTAFKRAALLTEDKSRVPLDGPHVEKEDPYRLADGSPLYPYVWTPVPEHKTLKLEMQRAENGDRRVASFSFDQQPNRPGCMVHVVVWIVKFQSPGVGDMALPSHDTRFHAQAHAHFNASLLKTPAKLVIALPEGLQMPPPPTDDETLPSPPSI